MSVQSNRSPEVNRAETEILPDPAELSTMNYSQYTHNTAPTRFAQVGGGRFAHRRFGNPWPWERGWQPKLLRGPSCGVDRTLRATPHIAL
jgi:hypothetical protein